MTENKIRIFNMPGPQREEFPDDETYQKAIESINRANVAPVSDGQDFTVPVDKIVDVFWALLNNAGALGMGFLQPNSTGTISRDLALEKWETASRDAAAWSATSNKDSLRVSFDYVCGRPIKTSFVQKSPGDAWSFNTRLYERDQPNPAALITAILES